METFYFASMVMISVTQPYTTVWFHKVSTVVASKLNSSLPNLSLAPLVFPVSNFQRKQIVL